MFFSRRETLQKKIGHMFSSYLIVTKKIKEKVMRGDSGGGIEVGNVTKDERKTKEKTERVDWTA